MDLPDPKKQLAAANLRFSKAFYNFLTQWSIIYQFRTVSRLGSTNVQVEYENYVADLVQQMKPGGELSDLLVDADSFFSSGADKELVKKAANMALKSASLIADAASLIFAHSLLDAFLHKCFVIAHIADPHAFVDRLKDKQVSLHEILNSSSADIITEKTCKELRDIERESLIKKTDILHMLCKPGEDFYREKSYTFDRKRLKEIDTARHDVVHGPDMAGSLSQIESDLNYLYETGFYFISMMHTRYGLVIIPGS